MADLKESFLFKSVQDQARHWYYAYKIKFIRQLLCRQFAIKNGLNGFSRYPIQSIDHSPSLPSLALRALDIGAGNGIISRSIGPNLWAGATLCWDLVDSAYLDDNVDVDYSLYREIPSEAKYDLIVAIDVVEHVENDDKFIDVLLQHLNPSGLILICVPAFQFLWSRHDVFLGHYRRYRLKRLVRLFGKDELRIIDKGYLYVLLFPVVALVRMLNSLINHYLHARSSEQSDLQVYTPLLNASLRLIMILELGFLRLFPIASHYFGVSAYILCKKY